MARDKKRQEETRRDKERQEETTRDTERQRETTRDKVRRQDSARPMDPDALRNPAGSLGKFLCEGSTQGIW